MNYSKLKKILMLIEAATPSGYILSQDEKDKIKQAWKNRNNPIARGMIEDAWNQSSDEKKRAAIEYAESQGWDFSEMRLSAPPPVSNQQSTLPPSTQTNNTDLEKTLKKIDDFIKSFNKLTDEEKSKLEEAIPNTNMVFGEALLKEAVVILNELSNIDGYSPESQEFLKNNKDDVVKKIQEFNDILKKHAETNYPRSFKPKFDIILGSSAFVSAQGDQPSSGSTTTPTLTTTQPPPSSPATDKPKYDTSYTGPSIVDFLKQSNQPSDFESRRKLAVDLGIVSTPEEYEGLPQQNIRMLDMLRGTTPTMDGVETRKAELAKPYTKPKGGQGPTIRYAGREYPAYIDMGGGKYRLAYQEELDNPNMQLYIPNPKKGQQEYGKPNFVKVRREGGGIRRQSQFGGAVGSASNLLGDIGNTLAGKR